MEKSFEQRVAEAKANVAALSPQEANERKSNDPHILFIDPRDAEDIRSSTGIIPGALNMRLSDLNENPDDDLLEKLASRSRPIIASCGGGPMGALAAFALKQRGFSNVSFIDGGTQGWLEAGFATTR
jgi:rhodanese-related sulfurtransferase